MVAEVCALVVNIGVVECAAGQVGCCSCLNGMVVRVGICDAGDGCEGCKGGNVMVVMVVKAGAENWSVAILLS